jgi:hypothetical protein
VVGIDQLVRGRWRLGQDAEPCERVLAEVVLADLALGYQEAAVSLRSVGADHIVALDLLIPAVVGELDGRAALHDALDGHVADAEQQGTFVAVNALLDQVDEHLVLRVHRHRTPVRELGEVDPMAAPVEPKLDAVVRDSVSLEPGTDTRVDHHVDAVLFEDPSLDGALDGLPALKVDHG